MKRLDRYVMKEMLVPFIAGAFIVALLFEANEYIAIAKEFNLDNIPVIARIQWLLYTLPSNLKLTLPTGMALAASLSVGRMGRESEITAVRAAGAPVRRLMRPVILFGLLAGLLNFIIVDRLIPTYGPKAAELTRKNAVLGLTTTGKDFRSNAFIQLNNYAASFGAVRRLANDKLAIDDVMLVERGNNGVKTLFVSAHGTYDAGLWTFPEGFAYAIKGGDLTTFVTKTISFDQTTDLETLMANGTLGLHASYEETPTQELLVKAKAAQLQKTNPRPYEIEYHSRYAAAFACAIFAYTSAIFAALFSRSGGFAGLLVSFSVVVLYFNAYVISVEILGKQDNMPTWLAAWLPNVIFGLLGLAFLRRLE